MQIKLFASIRLWAKATFYMTSKTKSCQSNNGWDINERIKYRSLSQNDVKDHHEDKLHKIRDATKNNQKKKEQMLRYIECLFIEVLIMHMHLLYAHHLKYFYFSRPILLCNKHNVICASQCKIGSSSKTFRPNQTIVYRMGKFIFKTCRFMYMNIFKLIIEITIMSWCPSIWL